jgi:hypothetical protein
MLGRFMSLVPQGDLDLEDGDWTVERYRATKLATHGALRAAFPDCRLVVTSNSDVDDHMNAINEAMGRVLESLVEYRRRL